MFNTGGWKKYIGCGKIQKVANCRLCRHGGGYNLDYLEISLPDSELRSISNLGLAHIGDAVYELMVRTYLICSGKGTNHGLHKAAVARVSAKAQAKSVEMIMSSLDQEEEEVFRRGRNTHVHAVPHGATPGQYHAATGLETLFGYLYLKGRRQRLNELFELIMEGENAS